MHETADLIQFTAQAETAAWGHQFDVGDSIEVLLGQRWSEDDGIGEGGPWGFGGYTTETITQIAERIWERGNGCELFCKGNN